MVKSVSLHTAAIDDIDLAVAELVGQLKNKLALCKNSIGIVQCDPEFIEAGIMPKLYNALSFPIVGGTTVSSATNDGIGEHLFSMMILTSNETEFLAGHTTGLVQNYEDAIVSSMQQALGDYKLPLRLAIIFPTVTNNENLPGDCYVEAVEKVCGKNVPVFGTLSVDDSLREFDRSMSVYNGESFAHEASYVLVLSENIKPEFFVATVPKTADLADTSAIVTKSNGHIVQEIDNMPAVKFFESVNLAENGNFKPGVYFVPFLVTKKDVEGIERTFVRALTYFSKDGYVHFRGKVPEGAMLSVASLKADDVLDETAKVVQSIADKEKNEGTQAVLIFSCIIRRLSIGSDALKEISQIKNTLQPDVAFVASYSGGEISPIGVNSEGEPLNAFHNYSLIACLL